MMIKKSLKILHFERFFGGGSGIRTHVTVKSNGFQDRLVMTASIPLRIKRKRDTNIKKHLRQEIFTLW